MFPHTPDAPPTALDPPTVRYSDPQISPHCLERDTQTIRDPRRDSQTPLQSPHPPLQKTSTQDGETAQSTQAERLRVP